MAENRENKMIVQGLRISVTLGLLLAPCIASAQQLDNSQIMSTLGQVKAAAPAIDVALLVEEANANVGKGVAALPNWSKLKEFSQLIVEIDFENNSTAIEPKSYRTVGLIADALHHPDLFRYKFLIVGHSSATGTPSTISNSARNAPTRSTKRSRPPLRFRLIACSPSVPEKNGRLMLATRSWPTTGAFN